jgi:hypothetical protein
MKKAFTAIAIILVIVGFGIIHSPSQAVEIAGGICVGLGSLYFIVTIGMSLRNRKEE